MFFLALQTMMF
uniref:Uncharacterized protein n=1 Tax=Rhizophora mucronata TaxID=61149 RepID=A0A2P2NPK6_RHIMU